MRILFVASRAYPYIGGLETYVYEVSRRLAAAGVDITVLSTDPGGKLPDDEIIEGVRFRRVRAKPARRDYYFAPAIYPIISQESWDLVHCQGIHNLVPPLAMAAARRASVPYLITLHSGGATSRLRQALRASQWRLLRPLVHHANHIVAISKFEASIFSESFHLPLERFSVIPYGADHLKTLGASSANSETDISACGTHSAGGPLIVSVGRLVRYKGYHRVIAAMPYVLRHVPDACLLIVGNGPYEQTLRRLVTQLRLDEHVVFQSVALKDRDTMGRILRRSALMVTLSAYESLGLTVWEAMAYGIPVLVEASTALKEYVDEGLARGVAPHSRDDEVGAAIVQALQHPLVPSPRQLPTWDECVAQLMRLYEQTLASAQKGAALR